MLKKTVILVAVIFEILKSAAFAGAAEVKFIAELPTPGEFTLFANGGWNGNWYVGYNHGWASNLPPVDTEGVEKAYIGARLGRAKTAEQIKKAFRTSNDEKTEISPGPYSILICVSRSKEHRPQGQVLTTTDKIPLEGSPVAALEGVTESRWFWKEVDKSILSSDSSNYIHIWSEDKELNSVEVSPILAAGTGSNKRENSYLVKGKEDKKDIRTIKFFEPALAIKLVGENPPVPKIEINSFKSHPVILMSQVIDTAVSGKYITEVGIQVNSGSGWESVEKVAVNPPYNLILDFKTLSPGSYKLRCWAKNWWEQISYSSHKTFTIEEEIKQ